MPVIIKPELNVPNGIYYLYNKMEYRKKEHQALLLKFFLFYSQLSLLPVASSRLFKRLKAIIKYVVF